MMVLSIDESGSQSSEFPFQEQQAGSYGNRPNTAFIPRREAEKAARESPDLNVKRGEMCFNHPWRQAYARCSYCKRPFCYADLVEHQGKQYCLEDLGHAAQGVEKREITPNRFTYLSSLLFLASSLILFYYTYPQALLLVNQAQAVGFHAFLAQLSYGYTIIIISSIFVLLGLISSVTVLSTSRRKFFASVLILFAMFIFFSYEYITGSSTATFNYLLYVTVVLFANMLMLALSRLGYEGKVSEKTFYEQMEWPKLETF